MNVSEARAVNVLLDHLFDHALENLRDHPHECGVEIFTAGRFLAARSWSALRVGWHQLSIEDADLRVFTQGSPL